jgi:hypothetical protein
MTVSPSLEAPLHFERTKYLFEKNILVAIGHDNETNEDEILQVGERGVQLIDWVWFSVFLLFGFFLDLGFRIRKKVYSFVSVCICLLLFFPALLADSEVLRLAHAHARPVHVTHLFNVSKFHHRDVGIVNLALMNLSREDSFQSLATNQNESADGVGAESLTSNYAAFLFLFFFFIFFFFFEFLFFFFVFFFF